MTPGERAATAARRTVGARFRVHGRDREHGLDCVGVAALALRAAGYAGAVPDGYALRGGDEDKVTTLFDAVLTRGSDLRPGDVVLMRTGPGQLHLGVWTGDGLVHADAGLRRVVERPGRCAWPVIGSWRMGD